MTVPEVMTKLYFIIIIIIIILCGVCMSSLFMSGSSPCTLASSHTPKNESNS